MKDSLESTLRQLRLSGLMQTLDVRLQEAAGHSGKSYRLRKQREASGTPDEPSNAAIAPTGSEAVNTAPTNRSGRKNRQNPAEATCQS